MPSFITFPNFLCLLLTGLLIVHYIIRAPVEVSLSELKDDLEDIFCKLPQSRKADDSTKCSSTGELFFLLKNGCSTERRGILQNLKNETKREEKKKETVEVEDVIDLNVEESEEQPEEEIKSSLVDSFVISLLVCSVIASLVEWHRERSRRDKKTKEEGSAAPAGREAVLNRRISLADLTVNRHIRRGESQQEGTQRHGIAQGSRPPLLRRSSFPAQIPEARPRHVLRQQSTPGTRRMSIDLEDNGSPDRRRVRILRRH